MILELLQNTVDRGTKKGTELSDNPCPDPFPTFYFYEKKFLVVNVCFIGNVYVHVYVHMIDKNKKKNSDPVSRAGVKSD